MQCTALRHVYQINDGPASSMKVLRPLEPVHMSCQVYNPPTCIPTVHDRTSEKSSVKTQLRRAGMLREN